MKEKSVKIVLGSDDMAARLAAEIAAEELWLEEGYKVELNNRRIEIQRATPDITVKKNVGEDTRIAQPQAEKDMEPIRLRHEERLRRLKQIQQNLLNKSNDNPWFKKQQPEGYRK